MAKAFEEATVLNNKSATTPISICAIQRQNTLMFKTIWPGHYVVVSPGTIFRNESEENLVLVYSFHQLFGVVEPGMENWTPFNPQVVKQNGEIDLVYNFITHRVEVSDYSPGSKFGRTRCIAKARAAIKMVIRKMLKTERVVPVAM